MHRSSSVRVPLHGMCQAASHPVAVRMRRGVPLRPHFRSIQDGI
jgi:hypothetical protein